MHSQEKPSLAGLNTGSGGNGSSLPVFILDIGTHAIKSGVHTSHEPHSTPSLVGLPRYTRCLPGPSPPLAAFGGVVVGHDARRKRWLLRLSYPVQNGGAVVDWEGFRPLLRQSIHDALAQPHASNPSARPFLDDSTNVIYSLVESPFASRPQRARLAEMLFEGSEQSARMGPRAAGLFCGVGPLLALYATGQTTGLVVDVGDGGLSTAAAVDGYVLPPCLQHDVSGASGAAVTTYLTQLLYRSGVLGPASLVARRNGMPTTAALTCSSPGDGGWGAGAGSTQERELVYAIKEACCAVSATPLIPSSVASSAASVTAPTVAQLNAALLDKARHTQGVAVEGDAAAPPPFSLPDGHMVQVGAVEALQAAEALFYPSLLGLEGPGVVDAVLNAVASAPSEVQGKLMENIVLTGGATCMPGFAKRFFRELQQRVDAAPVAGGLRGRRVCVTAPEHRAHAGWLGASFVAQLSTFASHMAVTRSVYEEEGEGALAKKVLT